MSIPQETLDKLLSTAKRMASLAYRPYSNFPVGAAVLTAGGSIFGGCNVENASYGLTICAERNAVFHAVADGHTSIKAVLVYTPTESATMPCGACRQVISEFGPGAIVIACSDASPDHELPLTALLPHAFGPSDLQ